MYWYLLWIPVIFSAGFGFGAWWVSRPDDVCRECRASYAAEIAAMKTEIHGLKSTKGRLCEELNAMAFRNAGYRAR